MVTNNELTIDQITYEALIVLKNKLALGNRCLRQYDKSFGETGAKIGDTLRVRVPARYQTATGPAFVQQAFSETYVPVAAQTQRQLGLSFGTAEMKLSIDDFSERVLGPGLVQMASDIDTDGTKVATSGYSIVNNGYVTANYAGTYAGFSWLVTPGALVNGNQPANWTGAQIGGGTVGVAGATPQANAASPFFNAQAVLDNASAPQEDRYCVVSPQASAQLATNLFTLFNPGAVVSAMFEEGMISSDFAGAKFFRSPSIQQTVSGTWNAAGVNVAATVVTGASAIALGNVGNAAIVNSGDQFVVSGVYSVNPVTRISTGMLQIFTAVGQATANAAGNVTVSVYPAIANAGAYQTTTALPTAQQAVTFIGTANTSTYANFYYQKNAIALVVAPLDEDLDGAAVSNTNSRADSEEDGLSIRFVSQYNASTDQKIKRLDILYGWAVVRPSLGCLVKG